MEHIIISRAEMENLIRTPLPTRELTATFACLKSYRQPLFNAMDVIDQPCEPLGFFFIHVFSYFTSSPALRQFVIFCLQFCFSRRGQFAVPSGLDSGGNYKRHALH